MSELQPLGDALVGQVMELIHSGELPPGSEVNEVALAQRFGVSRGPVREALRRLQGVGLISREPYLRAKVTCLDNHEIIQLFEMREALEGMACRLAAQYMSSEDISRLAFDLEEDRANWHQGSGHIPNAPPLDFHARIVEGCGNKRIEAVLKGDVYQLMRLYRKRSGSDLTRKAAAYQEHWQILRAIKTRDPELAESLMRSHVSRAVHNLVDADDVAQRGSHRAPH